MQPCWHHLTVFTLGFEPTQYRCSRQTQLTAKYVRCRAVSGPQRSSSAATESQSSDGFSTCHHRDASGTALSADTTPLRARTPASGCPTLRAKHEETEVQAALSPVTPPQAESLRRHDAATAETFAPAIKIEARDIATGGGHFGAPSLPWPQDDVGLSSYTQVRRLA